MSKPRITVLGSYNTDLVTFTPRMPRPGETILGTGFKTGPGGKGSNQAVAAARAGAAVTFVGRIGTDMFGDMALNVWQEAEILTDHVIRSDDAPTGVASIIVDENGENMIVVASGANWLVSAEDVERALPAIQKSAVFLTQLETPLESVRRGLELARASGLITILNPAPAQKLAPELLTLVDILTPNQTEAEIISGIPSTNAENACKALRDRGANTIVMTLGAEGVLLYDDNGPQHFPAFKVEQVVDTTGAGDAFNGALAVALAEGRALPDAIRFAAATGALSVTRPGATDSMPYRPEIEALLQKNA
ncbi:MAG: ribokinase [Anaerolineae bacterium]